VVVVEAVELVEVAEEPFPPNVFSLDHLGELETAVEYHSVCVSELKKVIFVGLAECDGTPLDTIAFKVLDE
jgi:hypothetical protein